MLVLTSSTVFATRARSQNAGLKLAERNFLAHTSSAARRSDHTTELLFVDGIEARGSAGE
jgi:hypothetical protein